MFKENDIPFKMTDLKELFFKSDKKIMKKKKNNLDFYSLVDSTISNDTDDKYRVFMRNLRQKGVTHDKNYVPMKFSALMEHFNYKGKIRQNMKAMDDTIQKIDSFLRPECFSQSIYEQDKTIHKNISYSKVVDNFKDIVDISSKKLPKKVIRKSVFTIDNNFEKLPNISVSENFNNGCLSNMNSLYDFYSKNKFFQSSLKNETIHSTISSGKNTFVNKRLGYLKKVDDRFFKNKLNSLNVK